MKIVDRITIAIAILLLSALGGWHTGDLADLRDRLDAQEQAQSSSITAQDLYYELTIGSFTAVHAYGGFKTYGDAEARVTWLKEQGLMSPTQPYFIQVRLLGAPLTVLDAGGR